MRVSIDVTLIRNPGIKPLEKLVALNLLAYAGQKDTCFPSHDTLAAELGVNRNTVARAVTSLAKRGAIRILPNTAGRCNGYDVSSLRVATNYSNATKSGTRIDATKSSGPSAIQSSTNSDHSDSDHDHIYLSYSDKQQNVQTENEADQADNPHGNADELAAPAPTAASASGTIPCGIKSEAQREAARLGLETCCPSDPDWALADVEEALIRAGGELPNIGTLDQLIARFGIARVWSQARYLDERIDRYKLGQGKPVLKPTAFFLGAVEKNAGPQHGARYSENAELCTEWFRKSLEGAATVDDAPAHIRKYLAYLTQVNQELLADVPEIIAEAADDDIEF